MVLTLAGGLGIVVPVLPTTPFILLAAGCFAISSKRLLNLLYRCPVLGAILKNYKNKTGVSKATKACALAFLWVPLCVSIVLTGFWVRLALLAVGAVVTLHIVLLRPKLEEENFARAGFTLDRLADD